MASNNAVVKAENVDDEDDDDPDLISDRWLKAMSDPDGAGGMEGKLGSVYDSLQLIYQQKNLIRKLQL